MGELADKAEFIYDLIMSFIIGIIEGIENKESVLDELNQAFVQ